MLRKAFKVKCRRGSAERRCGGDLQGQNENDTSAVRPAQKAAALSEQKIHNHWSGVRSKDRQVAEQNKYLVGDESIVQKGEGSVVQGVPA